MGMRGMPQQMTDMRKSMEEDKQIGVLMAGLRGSNMDESDFADDSVVMQLVEVAHDDADQLPLAYDPERIADFWGRRPVAVIRRALQLLGRPQAKCSCLQLSVSSFQLQVLHLFQAAVGIINASGMTLSDTL